MNHRILLAAAVAAAFAAPAFADVTVYGSLRTGIEYSVVSGPGAFNQTRLVDQSSRMGFKGSDKLDNGMTVSWKTEEIIRVGGNSSSSWGGRDQFISLDTNGGGTITAGKQIDSFGDWSNAAADNAFFTSEDSNLYQSRFTGRQKSALKYVSPTLAGFTANVSYIFGGKSDSPDYNNFGYAGLISYDGGGMFSGSIGMIQINDANGPLYSEDEHGVVLTSPTSKYTTNRAYVATGSAKLNEAWSLGAHYELYKSDDRSWKRQQYGLGVAYAAGKWGGSAWLLRADKSRYDGVKHDDAVDQLNLNVHYDLSKNTKAGVAYTYQKKGSESNTDADGLTTASGLGVAGQKVHALSFNIRTNF